MKIETKPQHTPTPWKLDGNDIVVDAQGMIACAYGFIVNGKAIRTPETFANAAFIVRAVNSHEALINALKVAEASARVQGATLNIEAKLRDKEANEKHALEVFLKADYYRDIIAKAGGKV